MPMYKTDGFISGLGRWWIKSRRAVQPTRRGAYRRGFSMGRIMIPL